MAATNVVRPGLVFFYSARSGSCRRTEGFLAQVLQRRKNHGTFSLYRVAEEERPDLVERFRVAEMPTLLVVEQRCLDARMKKTTGCRHIRRSLDPCLE